MIDRKRSLKSSIAGTLAVLASLSGCSSDDDGKSNEGSTSPSTSPASHPLVIVTERQGTDTAFHYLHVIEDWPSSGELDREQAIELGTPGVTHVQDGAIFFYHAEEGSIQKFVVNDELEVTSLDDETISFAGRGIMGFDPEPIWAAKDRAYMLDEKSAQIARWNPQAMRILGVDPVNPDVLMRDGLNVQFQLGLAAGDRLFTSVNWRNWDTNKVIQATALGMFDQASPANGPQIVEDDRCAASVAVGPWKGGDGYIYAVGDGAQGYDLAANPNPSPNPQCVVRIKEDGEAFDKDFFVDLQQVTGSPAIYMAYPMAGQKLLVSMWSPDVNIDDVKDPTKPGWYWELHPDYEYAIVDLKKQTSTKVDALERGAIQSQKTLILDGKNYVQVFRGDRGSSLYRVDADGTVSQVLENPTGTNIQFLGRL